MESQVLVVDDDPLICKGLKYNLEKAGYRVVTATNSRAATDIARLHTFQAAILDIGLPGEDGLSLCHYLKSNYQMPVIFLTARRGEMDEIIGLEVGADDYIVKPFNVDVLLAHLRAVLRRAGNHQEATQVSGAPVTSGKFFLNPRTHEARLDGRVIDLSPREFELLAFFLQNVEQVFTVNEIIERVWGAEYQGESQVLYVQVRSLREKIEPNPSQPSHLLTLRGVGYKFVS